MYIYTRLIILLKLIDEHICFIPIFATFDDIASITDKISAPIKAVIVMLIIFGFFGMN